MKQLTWLFLLFTTVATAQTPGWWRASLQREDGFTVDFNIEIVSSKSWFIRNASERLPVTNIQQKGDSILVQMPVFESEFKLVKESGTTLRGIWIKGTATSTLTMPVVLVYNQAARFPNAKGAPLSTITGRWEVEFADKDKAIAEFKQNGSKLSGSVLTPTGDYRFLEGTVHKDTLQLSTFDGSHAYYFRGVVNKNTIKDGLFVSGPSYKESWTAVKNANAILPDTVAAVYLKRGEERLNFRFPDLDSNLVSLNDERFRNKVVVIQLMGSWCPNCMDETAFLSNYYNVNKGKGVEMLGLAYEYTTDWQRSVKSLRKFQQHFKVQYPMLITGVRVGDTLRTEKTLPQVTRIKMFPTTIFIGRDGKVKKIHTGFMGPGTGQHYEAYKKDFYATIDELLKQKL